MIDIQWFGCFSLGGPEQWNNSFTNFFRGPVEIFAKTMILSTFWAGVPGILEQWNNGLDVFHWGDRNNGTMV
nr:MAG: hypothetical protein [Bacteriophage sp.]